MATLTPARKRLAILAVVVGGVLIADRLFGIGVGGGGSEADAVVGPRSGARTAPVSAAAAPEAATGLRLDRLDARERVLAAEPGDATPAPFEAVAWQAPAAAAAAAQAAPPPPPPPAAPPFSYVYMGGLTEDGVRTAFFTRGDRLITVKVGDTVDAAYRIDQMTDAQMTLTYLPLNQTLAVALGSPP